LVPIEWTGSARRRGSAEQPLDPAALDRDDGGVLDRVGRIAPMCARPSGPATRTGRQTLRREQVGTPRAGPHGAAGAVRKSPNPAPAHRLG
jgi:hypothetical protein